MAEELKKNRESIGKIEKRIENMSKNKKSEADLPTVMKKFFELMEKEENKVKNRNIFKDFVQNFIQK